MCITSGRLQEGPGSLLPDGPTEQCMGRSMCFRAGLISFYDTFCLEEFEDTKGIIRFFNSKKDRQHNGQKKTLHRKLNIERHEKTHVSRNGKHAVPAPLVTPVGNKSRLHLIICS